MKHLVIDGRRLEYRDFPATIADQPVLLLLHEGLGCVTMWRHFPRKTGRRNRLSRHCLVAGGLRWLGTLCRATHATLHASRGAGGFAGFARGLED